MDYEEHPEKLECIWVYDNEFVKGLIHIEDREIVELYVEPFFQGTGIGKKLVEFAVREFDADNMWVLEKNEQAIVFYKRCGFQLTNERKINEGTQEYVVKMRRHKMFLETNRVRFEKWQKNDLEQATLLWGDPEVTRYICATGVFRPEDIDARLNKEVSNGEEFGLQYWPIFHKESGELIGCCGLRPRAEKEYEIGFHLRPKFWRQGYAVEAANAVINYAFEVLKAETLFAGHNPKNVASKSVLAKLGFAYIGDEFYGPTGLYHPSYELRR